MTQSLTENITKAFAAEPIAEAFTDAIAKTLTNLTVQDLLLLIGILR